MTTSLRTIWSRGTSARAWIAAAITLLTIAALFIEARLTAQASCPCSIWTSSTTPGAMDSEAAALELGMKFRSDVPGWVTGVKFYKYSQNSGTHVGSLWTSSGTLLGRATFSGETASGWQSVSFASPVAVSANTTYVISYHTNVGHYASTSPGFTTAIDKAPLHALADGASGGNGVFVANASPTFPNQTWGASNYWVDLVFATSIVVDSTPPLVTAVTPTNGTANVAPTSTVTATFNEAMLGSSITSSAIVLKNQANAPVSAGVTYNSNTLTATLTPNAPLANSATYTATVLSGSGGVKDAAGNALANDFTWSFTTAADAPPTVTTVTPANGAGSVPPTTTVTAKFSEAMNGQTINASTFLLTDPNNNPVGASVGYSSGTVTATLTPSQALANATTYTMTVIGGASGVTDSGGTALSANFVSTFTTGTDLPPTVVSTTPASNATGVATTAAVTVKFSEAMMSSTINGQNITLKTGTTNVGATVTYNTSTFTATLTPSTALGSGTQYTASVKGGTGGVADTAGNVLASTYTWNFTTATNNYSTVGQWSSVLSWPIVTLNATLLKTGEVLVYDGGQSAGKPVTHGGKSARLWNPQTQAFTSVPLNSTDLFCSSACVLPDGRVVVVGGGDPSNDNFGVPDANMFNPSTRVWTTLPSMSNRRWYPTATCLPDGRVLVTSGSQFNDTDWIKIPEIYNATTNSWSRLTGASASIPYYPHVFILPDGRALDSSTFEQPIATDALNISTQQRTTIDSRKFDAGSAVMYVPGKILKTGTAAFNNGSTSPAASTAYVLDVTSGSGSWRQTNSMKFARSYHTLTSLPDGSVIVTGGGTTKSSTDTSKAVYEAEIWSPQTELWTTMSRMATPRLYHSIGMLLPDGRVLVAGGGRNFTNSAAYTSAEIFSPPYLFKGPRPTISSVPAGVGFNDSFFVGTPDATSITSVALVRPGSVTHGFNNDQRYVPVTFQQAVGGLTVQAPANANLAPPGYYMVFIVNSSGVPSVAAFLTIG